MAEVLDLSSLKNKSSDTPTYDSLSPEERAKVDAMAAGHELPATKVRTAFLVVVDDNGAASVLSDLSVPLDRRYLPTAHDVIGAAAVIQADATAQMAGQHAAMGIQQVAHMQMEQMQNQQMLAHLNLGK